MKVNTITGKILRRIFGSVYQRMDSYVVSQELSHTGVGDAGKIFTYTSPRELRALYDLASFCSPRSKALEIGSHLGASSCYIAAGLNKVGGHLYCVDTWENQTMPEGGRDTFADFKKNTSGVSKYITPVRKNSFDLTRLDVPPELSFIFIDGDHSFQAVKRDFLTVQEWLSSGGVIAFHDCIAHEGVSRTIGEALASGCWQLGGQVDNLAWIRPVRWRQ